MRNQFQATIFFALVSLLLFSITSVASANGTETLGMPDIAIENGSRVLIAGIGTEQQPANFNLDVPTDVTIKQVLLYWSGATEEGTPGDSTITVNGVDIDGTLIGTGPGRKFYESYRADITALGLVTSGENSFTVHNMDFARENDGVGILAIVDDGINTATIDLRDGLDIAYFDRPEPGQTTMPQSYSFTAASVSRTAELNFFVGSVLKNRPNLIKVTVGGTTHNLFNLLSSAQGNQWDVLTVPIDIPAGATDLTVQILSEAEPGDNRTPASLTWITSTLTVPDIIPSCADFSSLPLGGNVEGLGKVHPHLDISGTGNIIAIAEGQQPLTYWGNVNGVPTINGGLGPDGGFTDLGQRHNYTFTFAPNVKVGQFSLNMVDYGDYNPTRSTVHAATLTAYDAAGNVLAADSLNYTSDGKLAPRDGSAGDLRFSGDAATAVIGDPGNFVFSVTDFDAQIARVELTFDNDAAPGVHADPLFALRDLCFGAPPPPPTCIDLSVMPPGGSVQGLGTVHPVLDIHSSGNAVVVRENQEPVAFFAPNGPGAMRNGTMVDNTGFADIRHIHDYSFSFAPDTTTGYFSIRMLDFGDYNPSQATRHQASLVAYDNDGNVVAADVLRFTSDGKQSPRAGSAGDLYITADAATAQAGEPGNHIFEIAKVEQDVARLEIQYSNDLGTTSTTDPLLGMKTLCFSPVQN